MSGLRILVTGSRDWADRAVIYEALRSALAITTIGAPTLVVGCARGADQIAIETWRAIVNEVPGGFRTELHAAEWDVYGKAAGPIRNQRMVDAGAHVCLTFALPSSIGTLDCARRARAAGIPVRDYGVPTNGKPPA